MRQRSVQSTTSRTPTTNAKPTPGDPYRWHALVVVLIMCVTGPSLLAAVAYAVPTQPEHPLAAAAAELGVFPLTLQVGEVVYKGTCSACHGPDGAGIARLGKPLRDSGYVREHSDPELFSVIVEGRLPTDPANTTGAAMPARAGTGLEDDSVNSVIAYLRSMQDLSNPPVPVEDWVIDLAELSSGDFAGTVGHELYIASCSACHGAAGEGLEGLGRPLNTSEFVASLDDKGLVNFIKTGRPLWDADNTTGLDMPPKGGNPALNDEQLSDIVTYIRNLHE